MSSHGHDTAHELIDLVDTAYKHTTLGSFVKTIADVKSSDWLVLDWNEDPKLDIAVFYRGPRKNESWTGKKIQGLGHNNELLSKKKLMDKLENLLTSGRFWIEASDALAVSLLKRLDPITNVDIINSIFNVKSFNADGSYDRIVNGRLHTEYLFGDLNEK